MTASGAHDVIAALRDFVDRVDRLDPGADGAGTVEIRLGADEARLVLRAPVARALVEALRGYHDPRDRGQCGSCGGRALDQHFLCLDCGRPDGLFGQMVLERAARYAGDPAQISGDTPPGTSSAVDGG